MSLRFRLSCILGLLLALLLAAGVGAVVHNARIAITDEIESTASLTLQLLSVALGAGEAEGAGNVRSRLIQRVAELEAARHLRIELQGPRAESAPRDPTPPPSGTPGWFERMVLPESLAFRHALPVSALPYTEVVVHADPSDELAEVWQEVRVMLILIVAFTFVLGTLINRTVARGLRPLEHIQQAMGEVEHGDFRARLPELELPELQRLAAKFNEMAGALEQHRRENRRLASRTLTIQEEERRRLARELHDELGQSISGIKALAVSLQRASSEPETARLIVEACENAYGLVRDMLVRLRPALLEELGLATALERAVAEWNAHQAPAACELAIEGDLGALADPVRTSAYRIVQECLTNTARHARATSIRVRLTRQTGESATMHEVTESTSRESLLIRIEDDGAGFEPDAARFGFGLLGIRERVAALGGRLDIQSSPGAGARIEVTLPLGKLSDD